MSALQRSITFCLSLALLGHAAYGADAGPGIKQYYEKKYAEAESTLRSVVADEPENTEANYFLGLTLLEQKQFSNAREFLQKASNALPEARVALAKTFMLQDKLPEALGVIQEAEDRKAEVGIQEPQSSEERTKEAELYVTKGMILLKQEKAADAAAALDKALALDAKHGYANYYMGMAQSKLKRTDRMINYFEIFLQVAPNAPEAARVRSLLRSL